MAANIDMTSGGNLTRKIIIFALPLIASGIVQQSFNSMDVAVVGRFVGSHALAAVGANGPVISLIINLFLGVSVGSNVVIATCIGQRNTRDVARAVSTSAVIALAGGITLMVLGLTVATPILGLLDTPQSIIDDATLYLRLLSLGFPAMMVYNFASAILRSVGDTRRPFYWLVIGGLINVCLNLFFVLCLDMGVHGVAVATVIANYVSAAGVTGVLMREKSAVRLELRKIRLWRVQLRKILNIGLPAGVQGMVFALSNVFILSAINSFGPDAIAGSAAALNYEMYCYFVLVAFVQACMAFMSQNYGAGNYQRCRQVYRRCLFMGMAVCAVLNVITVIFHTQAIEIFTTDAAALKFGSERIVTVLAWQWIAGTYEVSGAALRALGYSLTPTVLTVLGTCVVRVTWVAVAHFTSFAHLLRIYPYTWVITGTAVVLAWLYVARRHLQPSIKTEHQPNINP